MDTRRKFIKKVAALGSIALVQEACTTVKGLQTPIANKGFVISTWDFGIAANKAAMAVIEQGGRAVEAVEKGVHVPEADPTNQTVGIGGLPDRDGFVTLDACIMDEFGNAGSVAAMQHIVHPISVARLVMERTPHVMLVGDGALQFALANGFQRENLLTEKSKADWEKWKQTAHYEPIINIENHDTIGMLAMDNSGNLAGACTTSGMAYKMHGRVGDSPLIGAGLFVDNEVGAATSTGLGEAVIRCVGSFLVVELMRQGYSPRKACEEAVMRIVRKQKNYKELQVGFLAIDKQGNHGAYAIHEGFTYALYQNGKNLVYKGDSYMK
jgi:N4-(beta-N-acetylglucosaminyl)-L-asparaginase